MKIWLVKDLFQGTGNDSDGYSIVSAWLDEDIARAVAASRYAHSVDDIEVDERETVPEYAREAYDDLMKWKRKNPKKKVWDWERKFKYGS